MPSAPELRQISRDKLYAIFKSWELVKLFEDLLYAVTNTLPGAADSVQAALDAHIADTGDAHQASAIGSTPVGGISANNVQDALAELDSEKLSGPASVNASRLLGRGSASGAGAAQAITLGTGLSMSGTTLSATGGGAPAAATYARSFMLMGA